MHRKAHWIAGLVIAGLGALCAEAFAQTAFTPAAAVDAAQAPKARAPIFVLNSLDASISIVDPSTFAETQRLPTGKEPHHLYLSPDEKSLLVANAMSDSLTLIDPKTGALQRTVTGIDDPYHLAFSPDMKWFVTAANRLDHVTIYRYLGPDAPEPFKLVAKVAARKTPSHLAIDRASTVVYASLQDSDEITAIDLPTQKTRWTVSTGKLPADVFLTPDDKKLLVGLTGDEFVEVFDVSGTEPQSIKRIRTGAGAHAFRGWGDGRHVLVSNRVANTISRIDMDTLEVVDTYPAPGGPDCIDVMTAADGSKTILVTSRWARKLTEIDPAKRRVVRQVAVGRSPHGVWTLDHAPRR